MISNDFLVRKLERLISRKGLPYTFKREPLDERNEPVDGAELVPVVTLSGVFHQGDAGYITLITGDGATVQSKHTQSIMAKKADLGGVRQNDIVEVNSKTFKVTGVTDIGELNIVADISIEEVKPDEI